MEKPDLGVFIINQTKISQFLQFTAKQSDQHDSLCLFVGVIGVIWAIMWFFLVYNSPAEHPRISTEERDYIEKALNKKGDGKVVNSLLPGVQRCNYFKFKLCH